MPRTVTVYRVFIGSPGGLGAEREQFRQVLERFNRIAARHHDVQFEPVGWEDTLPGRGRPQAQINEDLKKCDYAIFVFHDRWGSETGNGDMVGTEEEWQLAQQLYRAEGGYQLRRIGLYFKDVPEAQAKDPGDQLRKVIDFKDKIFASKEHLCGTFTDTSQFAEKIEEHLGEWLAKREEQTNDSELIPPVASEPEPQEKTPKRFAPDFEFWMKEFSKVRSAEKPDHTVALSHITQACELARNDEQAARALFGKGFTLGALDRSAEAIANYDELISRYGESDVPAMQEQIAKALINKGIRFGALDRGEEAIAAFDMLLARFGGSDAPALQERVAKALFNKGITLGAIDRGEEEIAAYDMLLARFGGSDAPALQEPIAKALINKGNRLGALDRGEEAIAAFDELIARFGGSDAPALQEPIAKALFNKSCSLAKRGKVSACIAALDQWAEKHAGFDCERIANDGDFDAIRSKPTFVRYLRKRGCLS